MQYQILATLKRLELLLLILEINVRPTTLKGYKRHRIIRIGVGLRMERSNLYYR